MLQSIYPKSHLQAFRFVLLFGAFACLLVVSTAFGQTDTSTISWIDEATQAASTGNIPVLIGSVLGGLLAIARALKVRTFLDGDAVNIYAAIVAGLSAFVTGVVVMGMPWLSVIPQAILAAVQGFAGGSVKSRG